MKSLTKKQILGIAFIILLIFVLPLTVFLSKKRQDIRPRAMQGKANLLLSSSVNSSNVGKFIDVLVSLQLTDPSLKVSGADFLLLYDKEKLDVKSIVPAIPSTSIPKPAFTDTLMLTSGGIFDATFNYLRVVEVAKKTDAELSSGTLTLAKITFLAKGEGAATIKFPDDNKYIEISGTGTYIIPTSVIPTSVVTPTSIAVTSSPSATIAPTPITLSYTVRKWDQAAGLKQNGKDVRSDPVVSNENKACYDAINIGFTFANSTACQELLDDLKLVVPLSISSGGISLNWGGINEKWFLDKNNVWYYIYPVVTVVTE